MLVKINKHQLIWFQLHDDEFSDNALDSLLHCMAATPVCCAPADIVEPAVTSCIKTQGVLGEIANNFTTSQSITAGYLTLSTTLATVPTIV